MRGSVLGIGSDIAGSIRIPAICNGTYAIRPSANRIPEGGQTSPVRNGLMGVESCVGPLATSTRDLELLLRCVVNTDPWEKDPSVIFNPWRQVPHKPALRLGFILEDSHFPLHPPVLRTLTATTEKLKQAGHEIIPLTVPSIKEACLLGFRFFAMDPASTFLKHISASGEPIIPALGSTKLPSENLQYEYAPMTLEGLYDLNEQRNWYKEQFRNLFVENRLDGIVMAGNQGTAVAHDQYGFPAYTVLWNVVDVSVIHHIPTRKLTIISIRRLLSHLARRIKISMRISDATWCIDLLVSSPDHFQTPTNIVDDADATDGAPCCIQLVGRNLHEEELLDMTETVSNVLTK